MSVIGGPKIITDKLVLYLDSANNKSYQGNGTKWLDLSHNNNNATMYGNVSFETDIFPCFNFSGASGISASTSSLGFTFSSNMVNRSGDFTLECWIKNPNTTYGQIGLFSNAGGADGYRFGVGQNGVYILIGPNYVEGGIPYSDQFDNDNWHNIVATFDRTNSFGVNIFLDGKYQNTKSIPTTQTTFSNTAPGLVRSSCCWIYTGKMIIMKVYENKLLTHNEILQNYNMLKGRFGL